MELGSISTDKSQRKYRRLNDYSKRENNSRDSDIYFETYSPLPAIDKDDPESMFSPSRPYVNTLLRSIIPFEMRHRHSPHYRRLVDRDGMFSQSYGKLAIRKKIKIKEWRELYVTDWFHSLVDSPTWRTLLLLLSMYMFMVLLFTIPYYYLGMMKGDKCALDIHNFMEAFFFSLETMATIGYSTKSIFFGDCVSIAFILSVQICVKIVVDALTIGVIYSRISRPTSRASTIIMSQNAIIRRINGRLYFMFQVCELRKHQLIEAHVRLYALKRECDVYSPADHQPSSNYNQASSEEHSPLQNYLDGDIYFQTTPMRITQPSDDRGAMLLLCLPQIVVHEINESSPLMPPRVWKSNRTGEVYHMNSSSDRSVKRPNNNNFVTPPRDMNHGSVNRASIILKSPSEMKTIQAHKREGSHENLSSYQSNKHNEIINDLENGESVNQAADELAYADETPEQRNERLMIQSYLMDRKTEIIVLIEGSDQATGGIVQARHSYIPKEIQWHQTFFPCVFEDELDGSAVIDFNLFHRLRPVSCNSLGPGAVASYVA